MAMLKIAWQLLEQYVAENSAYSGLDVSSFFRSIQFFFHLSHTLSQFFCAHFPCVVISALLIFIYLFIYDVVLLCIHFQCHEIMSHNSIGDDDRCFDIHLNILYVGIYHLSFNLIFVFFVEVCGCVRSQFMGRCLDAKNGRAFIFFSSFSLALSSNQFFTSQLCEIIAFWSHFKSQRAMQCDARRRWLKAKTESKQMDSLCVFVCRFLWIWTLAGDCSSCFWRTSVP